ncbi:MFS transporter [Actinokineospora sp. HUAS TT18]|uniref:MFS transporter n=1 Tax=Actinokineospora sp. HUAS TT18 TaxID=3447451 RepID=UPI003F520091
MTSPAATLFRCLFAGQAGLLVLTPVLSDVARAFGVSAATAGQLRAVSGAVAALVALGLLAGGRRWDLRDLLSAGLTSIATASAASAVAPTFEVLATAQVVLGAGMALVLAAGLAAAARWAPDGERAKVLSWALIGQPIAWVVGMPVVGVLGAQSWRLTWLLPLAASLFALVGVHGRNREGPEPASAGSPLRRPGVTRWAAGELLAFAGWAGVLVYSGSLLTDAHGVAVTTAGTALGAGAAGYVVGTFLARRWVVQAARRLVLVTSPALAAAAVLLGSFRPSFGMSVALFALTALLAGMRMMAGSALGLDLGAGPLQAMSVRAAAVQFGYFGGSALGGVGLMLAGWSGLGAVLAVFLLLSAVVTATPRVMVKVGA